VVFFSGHKYTSLRWVEFIYIHIYSVLLVVIVQQHRPSTGTLVLPKVHIVKTDPFTATGNTGLPTLKTLVHDTYMCEVNCNLNIEYFVQIFLLMYQAQTSFHAMDAGNRFVANLLASSSRSTPRAECFAIQRVRSKMQVPPEGLFDRTNLVWTPY
jgi:hypothetical protein